VHPGSDACAARDRHTPERRRQVGNLGCAVSLPLAQVGMMEGLRMVRPERFELPTFGFVVVATRETKITYTERYGL